MVVKGPARIDDVAAASRRPSTKLLAAGFVGERQRAGDGLGIRDEGDRHPADLARATR